MRKLSKPGDKDLSRSGPGTLQCSKCGAENERAANKCHECEAHLWVACHHCGSRNARSVSRCADCGGRLHKSTTRKLTKQLFKSSRGLAPWHFVLLGIAVWVTYRVVIYFASYQAPSSTE